MAGPEAMARHHLTLELWMDLLIFSSVSDLALQQISTFFQNKFNHCPRNLLEVIASARKVQPNLQKIEQVLLLTRLGFSLKLKQVLCRDQLKKVSQVSSFL